MNNGSYVSRELFRLRNDSHLVVTILVRYMSWSVSLVLIHLRHKLELTFFMVIFTASYRKIY